jgi:hypothetical protein
LLIAPQDARLLFRAGVGRAASSVDFVERSASRFHAASGGETKTIQGRFVEKPQDLGARYAIAAHYRDDDGIIQHFA